jgi:hypothetical protein
MEFYRDYLCQGCMWGAKTVLCVSVYFVLVLSLAYMLVRTKCDLKVYFV